MTPASSKRNVCCTPCAEGTVVGVAWGIFIAFIAGIALAAAGWRMRAHDESPPPPPLLRDDPRDHEVAPAPPARRPRPRTSAPVDVDDTAPTLFDDLPVPEPEDPPTRPCDPARSRPRADSGVALVDPEAEGEHQHRREEDHEDPERDRAP